MRDEEAEKTIQAVEALGRRATFGVADIADSGQVDRLFDDFLAAHGRVDISSTTRTGRRTALPGDPPGRLGADHGRLREGVLPLQPARGAGDDEPGAVPGGGIVSIASVHAERAWPNDTAYGVAKAAIVRMTMSMALDLAEHRHPRQRYLAGLHRRRVLPPDREQERGQRGYATARVPAIPTRTVGVPEDIAGVVVFLCSSLGDYVNGTCVRTDGGFLVGGTPE